MRECCANSMNQAEPVPVCEMTSEGIQEAKEYLSILRDGKRLRTWEKDLDELLSDPVNVTPVYPEILVQRRPFANRREVGEYLQPLLSPMGVGRIVGNNALWSWLGMFYLGQAARRDTVGNPKPSGGDTAYLLALENVSDVTGYRHRLMAAYYIRFRHGEKAWCMLDQPVHQMEHFTAILYGSPVLFNSVGVVELAHLLYADKTSRRYKSGIVGAGRRGNHAPGGLSRLVSVLNQLYMTYDVYGMAAQQLLDLLPPEFDRWKPSELDATS